MKGRLLLHHFKGPLLIIAAVLLANALYVSTAFKASPLYMYSGLAVNTKVGVLSSGQPTIDPNNAYTTQALGHSAARDLRHGHLPWWNYDEQVGAPLAGEMQSAALFMPFIFLLGLGGGLLLFHLLLQMVAGIGTYYLLRRLGCRQWTATTGGILFALNGTFAWLTNAAFNPIAFLPLSLLGIELLATDYKKRKPAGWILIAVSLALSLYAGFPETAYLDGLLAAVWTAVRLYQLRNDKGLRFLGKVVLGMVTGLLLAAPILIAFKDYYPYANVGSHNGAFKAYSLPVQSLPALLMPYIYGPIFAFTNLDKTGILQQFWGSVGGFASLSVLFLAVVGLFGRSKHKILAWVLGIWIFIAVGRTYGLPVVHQLVNLIPGISFTAFFRYAPPSIELVLIILAMFGLETLLRREKPMHARRLYMLGFAVLTGALALLVIALGFERNLQAVPHHHIWLILSAIASLGAFLIVWLAAVFHKGRYSLFIPIVIVVEAVLMFAIPQLSSPRSAAIDMAPVNFLKQNLGTNRFFSLGPIMPNYGSYYGIASINTNDLPISKAWSKYIVRHLDANVETIGGFTGVNQLKPDGLTPLQALTKNTAAYEAVGVKYVVTFKGTISPSTAAANSFDKVFDDGVYEIYELPSPQPYFQDGNACNLRVTDKAHLTADCAAPSTLLRRELFMPGWQARVNGKPVNVKQKGELFQSIALPEGKSTVSFTFLPPHMKLAAVAMVLGILAIAAGVANDKYHLSKILK